MEQMQARHSERLAEHDRDIKDLKADIRDLQKDVDSIKVNVTAVEKDIAIILNDGSHTRDALVEIKAESRDAWSKVEKSLEEIRKARENDHYIKPLSKHEARYEKIWWAIIGGGITTLVGAGVAALIAFL